MHQMIEWRFDEALPVPATDGSFELAEFALSGSGAGLFLFVESSATAEVHEKFGGMIPRSRMTTGKAFRLVISDGQTERAIDLNDIDFAFPIMDVLPDGRVFLASTRCEWRSEDDFDLNGMIIDPVTGQRDRFLLGDGIAGAQIDDQGRLWVSYFDEGIFGNNGWGRAGPEPLGASGLNCFDATGRRIWKFEPDDVHEFITECYALNVCGNGAQFYADHEFMLVRIGSNFRRDYWSTPLKGCRQFAMDGDKALFGRQYRESISRGYLGELRDGSLSNLREVEFCLPSGEPIADGALLMRGPYIHFLTDTNWYRARIGDV